MIFDVFFAKYPLQYARLICKVPRGQDFFPVEKKKFLAFFLIPMNRIICTIYHSTILTDTSFIQLDFISIIYTIYNKFITFLSYFDHDRKYPNSRIVVDSYKC